MKRHIAAKYHLTLAVNLGDWSYSLMIAPLIWQWKYQTYDLVGGIGGKMILLGVGPIGFLVQHEPHPPHIRDTIRPVETSNRLWVRKAS